MFSTLLCPSSFDIALDWIVSPHSNSPTVAITRNVTGFRDEAFVKKLGSDEVRVGTSWWIKALIRRDTRELTLSPQPLPATWDYSEPSASIQNQTKMVSWSHSLRSSKKINFCFKPSSLWCLVMAAWAKTETLANYFIALCLSLLICAYLRGLLLGHRNSELLYTKHLAQCLTHSNISGNSSYSC